MIESFVIMLREGVEAALVVGILLVVLQRAGRTDLMRPVFRGLGLAVIASVAGAFALSRLPVNEEAFEGTLYLVSAVFVVSMIWWMHRTGRTLRSAIEARARRATDAHPGRRKAEALGLGAFAFLMVFREGAETVLLLSAVDLTTDGMLGFLGILAGLAFSVVFCVMFVRGTLEVDLRRFFRVTGWVLLIFVAQLVVNGYHEFSEAGLVPATRDSMALLGPVVRNNTLFTLAVVAIPLFLWLTRRRREPLPDGVGEAERRLAVARRRRARFYRVGAVGSTLVVLLAVGVVFARDRLPRELPPPVMVTPQGQDVAIPVAEIEDGNLHRFGYLTGGKTVRFIALRTSDGRVRAALDACEICGAFGYVKAGANLLCLNCAAEINPLTVGSRGGCNPIPLPFETRDGQLLVRVAALEAEAGRFSVDGGPAEPCPVCGMLVRVNEASSFETYGGKTYYLCSMEHCRKLFLEDPSAYTDGK